MKIYHKMKNKKLENSELELHKTLKYFPDNIKIIKKYFINIFKLL